jgi:DNA modification methylase
VWDSVWGINPPIARLVGNAKERLPGYPTQLPLALLNPIVGCASDPGDLVVDLFAGSGSLGEAALRQGRRFVGFELNKTFAEKARDRLRTAVANALGTGKA